LKNKELARLMGQGETTASSWLGGFHHPHLVSWCCLLEQLTPAERQRFSSRICRELPTLEHDWIQHDPLTVGSLRNLLEKERGLTLITGPTASRRTFLVTAMGRSFTRVAAGHPEPAGIDIHQPIRFVPLPSVHYLRNPLSKEQGRKAVRALWLEVKNAPGRLALFNGVWHLVPELRSELVALAESLHVIIADEDVQPARNLLPHAGTHRLMVAGVSRNPNAIAVEIQCL
jgi:hypothetical protein